jgi:hypothetical protein
MTDSAHDDWRERRRRNKNNAGREAYLRSVDERIPNPPDWVINRLVVLMTQPQRAASPRDVDGGGS